MKLYYSAGACSLANHIVMAELNMAYELEAVNLKDKSCASGDFRQINPIGSVPALKMDNNEILTESAIISQYLCDMNAENTMLAKYGTLERFKTLEWMNFIATEVHKSFTPLFGAERMYQSVETQNDVKNFCKKNIMNKVSFISEKLGQNDFLTGKTFTIADAYMFTVLGWGKYVGVEYTDYSNVMNYLKRISERPSVIRALKEEGLIK